MNSFTFRGISSEELGLYVGSVTVDNAPKRRVESVEVPGRNGTLTIDGHSYENIQISYTCYIKENYDETIMVARSFYLESGGYFRLEDTFNPEEYRMARCVNGIEVTPSQTRAQGYFTLVFDAMPQRFLTSGEGTTTFGASGTINNPTLSIAKPLIQIYGTGTVGIGSVNITFDGSSEYVELDCELQDAYYNGANKNSAITLSPNEFPVLNPGSNGVTLGTGITRVVITPRWWRL